MGRTWGSGGGLVVSVLAFQSNDQILNPAEANSFNVKILFQKNENKQQVKAGHFLIIKRSVKIVCTNLGQVVRVSGVMETNQAIKCNMHAQDELTRQPTT